MDPLSDAAFVDLASMNPAEEDRKARVRFFMAPMPDPIATAAKGRPMFRSVEMFEEKVDRYTTVCQRVDRLEPDPRQRFPLKYAAFKQQASEQIDGTLLSAWGLITPADVEGYKAIKVYTVEQLAALSDADCDRRKIDTTHRQRARDFLAMAQGMEPLAQARAEISALRSQIDALNEQIVALGGKAQPAPVVAPPKRRGRPPKAKPAADMEH